MKNHILRSFFHHRFLSKKITYIFDLCYPPMLRFAHSLECFREGVP